MISLMILPRIAWPVSFKLNFDPISYSTIFIPRLFKMFNIQQEFPSYLALNKAVDPTIFSYNRLLRGY